MPSPADGPRVCVVTGTDTGVGKTTVTVALVRALRRRGHRVAACKPIETGCARAPSGLMPADALRLNDALDSSYPLDQVCPERFVLPAAPAVAAEAEGRPVDFDAIDRAIHALRAASDLLLIEGAGGLLTPFSSTRTLADLAADHGASIVVVARTALGTLNHTLLTIEAARARRLAVRGILLTATQPAPGPEESDTPRWLTDLTGVPVLGTLQYLPNADYATSDALADHAQRCIDLEALWRAF